MNNITHFSSGISGFNITAQYNHIIGTIYQTLISPI